MISSTISRGRYGMVILEGESGVEEGKEKTGSGTRLGRG